METTAKRKKMLLMKVKKANDRKVIPDPIDDRILLVLLFWFYSPLCPYARVVPLVKSKQTKAQNMDVTSLIIILSSEKH